MKIYACELRYDGLCCVKPTLESALFHIETCGCEVIELVLSGDSFNRTGVTHFRWKCENCGKRERTDRLLPLRSDEYGGMYCSTVCLKETMNFYAMGFCGTHGYTTRESMEKLGGGPKKDEPCYCWTTEENRLRGCSDDVKHYAGCLSYKETSQ